MSTELIDLSGGTLMLIISGKLSEPEFKQAQAAAAVAIQRHGKVRIVVIAEDFQGWDHDGKWDDLSFQSQNDSQIECMAIVGDRRWKDPVLAFAGKGFREFPIEYFDHGQLAKARAWLRAH
jgi:hypothetical protein